MNEKSRSDPRNSDTISIYRYIHIHIHPGGPETVLVKATFFKKNIFARAKQTCLQAELCQILAREFCKMRVSCGFWIHFIGACWQVFSFFFFKAGFSLLKLFFAGDGYADSHISTASTSHRGEDLCSLNTTSWGWSLWHHSMRHRLFQCGNWFSPFHGRLFFQTHPPFMYTAKQHYQTSVQRSNMQQKKHKEL